MFLFKTEIRIATNPEMGFGLFSKEFIAKDSVVWEFTDGVDIIIPIEKLQQMPAAQQEYFDTYGWISGDYCISGGDLTNFINHSDDPNLKNVDDIVIAIKNIYPGDELFENYQEFDAMFDIYKDTLI